MANGVDTAAIDELDRCTRCEPPPVPRSLLSPSLLL